MYVCGDAPASVALSASRETTVAQLLQRACGQLRRDYRQAALFSYVNQQKGPSLKSTMTLDEAAVIDGQDLLVDKRPYVACCGHCLLC